MRTTLPALAVALAWAAPAAARQAAVETAAATITQEDYARRVGVIAHDSMQGRDTPSRGLDKTAEWIASEFRRFGLRGGAEDGGFIQRYPLERVVLDAAASGVTLDGTRLAFGPDVAPLFGATADAELSGGLVLVGGDVASGGLASGSLEGMHALVVIPASGTATGRAAFSLVGAVRAAGAHSVLIASGLDDGTWRARAADGMRPEVRRPGEGGGRRSGGAPILAIRDAAVERLLAGRGVDLAALRAATALTVVPVAGAAMTVTQRVRISETSAPNVVGILDGSDPTLAGEHVVFSGHMDHVGIGQPDERGDSIYNGADDDASGTIAVVEIAEAMASMPVAPRRSTLFLLVSGEEKGLWGSEYFADHPGVPVDRLVANLNTDMIGRNWPDTIVAIGKEHSDLGATLERVNERHPELGMTAIDDLWPDQRFYFRSDHYNFARKGVPILFFFNGTHEDYHGVDDEPDRIDAEKAARITRLVFYLGVEVANADERPRWNPESLRRIVSDPQ